MFRIVSKRALINRMGFNNEGLDSFIANVKRSRRFRAEGGILGLNIGKNAATPIENAADDYLLGLRAVPGEMDLDLIDFDAEQPRTQLSEQALHLFHRLQATAWWAPLLWTPLCTAAVVWVTRRWAPGAAGSGIPQVMAALSPRTPVTARALYVSVRLALAKMVLTSWGLLGGLSQGREGPSVQIAAGVMHAARRFLPQPSAVSEHSLLIAGGAAGIAAAFNTPLGGVIFAIEELSRRPEQRYSGLLIAAIMFSGLIAVAAYGNVSHFGVIRASALTGDLLGAGLLVALICGGAGGLFSRLLIRSLQADGSDRFSRLRAHSPLGFAALCGLAVAVMPRVASALASPSSTWTMPKKPMGLPRWIWS